MYPAEKIAEYLLSLSRPEVGDIISNLKLQKLLYYCQGFSLALKDGEPLFEEEIEAWNYGPVVPTIYRNYKEKGANYIEPPENFDFDDISKEAKEIMCEVYETYGQFSAWRLMQMTHEDGPWKDVPRNGVISKRMMEEYFKTQLID